MQEVDILNKLLKEAQQWQRDAKVLLREISAGTYVRICLLVLFAFLFELFILLLLLLLLLLSNHSFIILY